MCGTVERTYLDSHPPRMKGHLVPTEDNTHMRTYNDGHTHLIGSGGVIRHRLDGSTTVFAIEDPASPYAPSRHRDVSGHVLLWLTPDEALALACTLLDDITSLRARPVVP